MGELGEDCEGVVERGGAARFETGEGRGRGPIVKRGGAARFETGDGRGFMVKRGGAARFETGEGRGPMDERWGAARFDTGEGRGPAVGGGPGGGAATLALTDATALR